MFLDDIRWLYDGSVGHVRVITMRLQYNSISLELYLVPRCGVPKIGVNVVLDIVVIMTRVA